MKVSHLCARDIATVASTEAVGDRNFSLTAMPISPVYEGQPRRKRSTGKATWPGIKQVWRSRDLAGCFAGDVLALASDVQPGEPLLQPAMRGGLRTGPAATLAASRACAAAQVAALPAPLRSLRPADGYPVADAPALQALVQQLDAAGH